MNTCWSCKQWSVTFHMSSVLSYVFRFLIVELEYFQVSASIVQGQKLDSDCTWFEKCIVQTKASPMQTRFFSSMIYQESSFKVVVFSRRELQNNYYLKKKEEGRNHFGTISVFGSCIKPLMEQKENISYLNISLFAT